jgi:hypothetical protein
VKPGLYHLVIYSGPKGRKGTLVADAPRWQLRVRRPDPVSTQDGGSGMSAWVGGAAIAGACALLALGVLRRRAAAHGQTIRARSTSR